MADKPDDELTLAVRDAIARLGKPATPADLKRALPRADLVREMERRYALFEAAGADNLPCRVALLAQSPVESRMMLQQAGAERLTGFGDLLYKDIGDPVRLQAPYLPVAERARIFDVVT